MLTQLRTFLNGEDGATPIEYGLIAALISVAVIDSLTATGNSPGTMSITASSVLSGSALGCAGWAAPALGCCEVSRLS